MPKKGESIKLIPKIPYVILCEGRDEELFLRCYVSHLVEGKVAPDTFNIINLGGNEELQKKLRVLHSVEYYDHMQGFLIIRDAEASAVNAARSLQKSMNGRSIWIFRSMADLPKTPRASALDSSSCRGKMMRETFVTAP